MLSIRFNESSEWWVSSRVFNRLFDDAVAAGDVPGELRDYGEIANANGGLGLAQRDPVVAVAFSRGLKQAAQRHLAAEPIASSTGKDDEEEGYRRGLEELLRLLARK